MEIGLHRVSIVDQDGKEVGHCLRSMKDMTTEEAFTDECGTVWTRPTAWAYFAACRARDRDAAPRGREAAEAEGQQPGPKGIAQNGVV